MKQRVWSAVGLLVLCLAGCRSSSLPGGDLDGDGWKNREDCGEEDPGVNPGAPERCNGKDDNCNDQVDEELDTAEWYTDTDQDGWGDPTTVETRCGPEEGEVGDGGDCDDGDEAIHPSADERCDDVDSDCDGRADEAGAVDAAYWYGDADGDGHGGLSHTAIACSIPSGYSATEDDCDDGDASIHPGAEETCDEADQDCDQRVDEAPVDGLPWYADADGDGLGGSGTPVSACTVPEGYAASAGDCDDNNPDITYGVPETCGLAGADEDCDGQVDEGVGSDWYPDLDVDGFGGGVPKTACAAPDGTVGNNTDCDEGDALTHPDAVERCDGEDGDCDGTIDEDAADAPLWYADTDSDGHGDPASSQAACEGPPGFVSSSDDCDDTSDTSAPGADEACNTLDDDCDGAVDEDGPSPWYPDEDGDGFGVADGSVTTCDPPSGYASRPGDCDDTDPALHPDTPWFVDGDGDGFGGEEASYVGCEPLPGLVLPPGDCDDGDGDVYPGSGCSAPGGCGTAEAEGTTDLPVLLTERDGRAVVGGLVEILLDDPDRIEGLLLHPSSLRVYAGPAADPWAEPYTGLPFHRELGDPAGARVVVKVDLAAFETTTLHLYWGPVEVPDRSATTIYRWFEGYDSGISGWTSGKSGGMGVELEWDTQRYHSPPGALGVVAKVDHGCISDGKAWASKKISVGSAEFDLVFWVRTADCENDGRCADPTDAQIMVDDRLVWDGNAPQAALGRQSVRVWFQNSATLKLLNRTQGLCETRAGVQFDDVRLVVLASNVSAEVQWDDLGGDCDPTLCAPGDTPVASFPDTDADGFGDDDRRHLTCVPPPGAASVGGDCDDEDRRLNPATTWYADGDGDGWGRDNAATAQCAQPAGFASAGGDCADGDGGRSPGAVDLCGDGIDQDCTGVDAPCGQALEGDFTTNDAVTRLTGATSSELGDAPVTIGDVTGDGLPDIISTVDTNGNGISDEVFIVPGPGPSGESALPSVSTYRIRGVASSHTYATAATFVGDVSGDGVGDLAVDRTVPDLVSSTNGHREVLIFFGPIGGDLDASDADASIIPGIGTGSASVSAVGDVDGDGCDDIGFLMQKESQFEDGAATVYLFYGPLEGELGQEDAGGSILGLSDTRAPTQVLASAGDIDGDGRADLLVFSTSDSTGYPIHLFYGPVIGAHTFRDADASFSPDNDYSGFEGAAIGAGDLDSDGFGDLALAVIGLEGGSFTGEGRVGVYAGPVAGLYGFDTEFDEPSATALIESDGTAILEPYHLGRVGDVDGDGKDDLLVSSTRAHSYLFYGPLVGVLGPGDAGALIEDRETTLSGVVMTTARLPGDLDQDGHDDLLIADTLEGTGSTRDGGLFVFRGGAR